MMFTDRIQAAIRNTIHIPCLVMLYYLLSDVISMIKVAKSILNKRRAANLMVSCLSPIGSVKLYCFVMFSRRLLRRHLSLIEMNLQHCKTQFHLIYLIVATS